MAANSSEAPVPKIKYDWYQTETTVVIEVRIKGLKDEDVKVDFQSTTLSVTSKIPSSSSEYSLELDLAHRVMPEKCQVKVLGTKIEIKLAKAEGVRWAQLEGDGKDPLPGAGAGGGASVDAKKYPSSSGKDWNRIGADLEKTLEDDKPEGEQALNNVFQQIYADGSDEVKKAMNKSFFESGGTVLSTNWSDIGAKKTDVKPPDGMEFKKWDG